MLIIALERRLAHVQRHWPGKAKGQVNSNEERAFFGLDEKTPNEGTGLDEPQPVENTATGTENTKKVVNVEAPLTPEKIDLYRRMFPNRDLEFHIFEPDTPKAA